MATKQFLEKGANQNGERVIQACNGCQIPAISLDWAEQAWSSDFCEPAELPEVLENRIVDCKYFVGALQTLLVSLRHYSTRCNQSVNEGKYGCHENSDPENSDLRPQTPKTQTPKTQTSKSQTPKTQTPKTQTPSK